MCVSRQIPGRQPLHLRLAWLHTSWREAELQAVSRHLQKLQAIACMAQPQGPRLQENRASLRLLLFKKHVRHGHQFLPPPLFRVSRRRGARGASLRVWEWACRRSLDRSPLVQFMRGGEKTSESEHLKQPFLLGVWFFKYSSLLISSSVLLPLFCFTSVWNLLSETIPEPRHLHSQTYSKWRNGQIYTAWHEGVSFVYHGFHRQVLTHFDLMINVSCCRWDQLRILNIVLSRKMTILYECMGESVRTGMWDTISRRGLTTPWLHFSHSFKIFLSQN